MQFTHTEKEFIKILKKKFEKMPGFMCLKQNFIIC